MKQAPFSVRRWTRAEYEALVERGVFDGEPLELLGGQLIVAEPQAPYRASSVGRITDALKAVLPSGLDRARGEARRARRRIGARA